MRGAACLIGLMLATGVPAAGSVYEVLPDGSGDFPTIQAAVDAAENGDTIELEDGTFTGAGNRAIDFSGKAITVRSVSGDPQFCVIDCQALGRGFVFDSGETAAAVLSGVTIRNGHDDEAGAILCDNADPTFINCVFRDNSAEDFAGAMFLWSADPTITDCVFSGNVSLHYGGAVHCLHSSPQFTDCTFSGNVAGYEAGVMRCIHSSPAFVGCTFVQNASGEEGSAFHLTASSPTLDGCIIAFGAGGEAVHCYYGSHPVLSCCDIFANEGGDWTGCIQSQLGAGGNVSLDPAFCSLAPHEDQDWRLQSGSPCSAEESGCGLIGAWGVGCDTPVRRVSWGAIKALYR